MSTTGTAVLHCLRVKGRAATAGIAEGSGVGERTVQEILEQAADDGLASYRGGRRGGWVLTPQGRDEVATLLAAEREGFDTAQAAALYDGEFLTLNKEFKHLCTRWQLAGANGVATEEVRSELTAIHRRNRELCARLAESSSWFGRYQGRFDAAYHRVQDGDATALVTPLSGSYHDVWIELHEDLYLLLDRVRDEDD
jgi:hypothetical protein